MSTNMSVCSTTKHTCSLLFILDISMHAQDTQFRGTYYVVIIMLTQLFYTGDKSPIPARCKKATMTDYETTTNQCQETSFLGSIQFFQQIQTEPVDSRR